MIKVKTKEYTENNLAILNTKITFFGISIFERENTTTNRMVVDGLISVKNQ